MTILVTGAAGLVGASLVEALLQQGHQVIGIDNFFRGTPENLSETNKYPNFQFIEGDICKVKKLPSVDSIFHLAAIVPTRYFYQPMTNLEVNIMGTKNILELGRETGVSKFIFASSSEIYGQSREFPTKENSGTFFESPDITPRWSYAVSKLAGEHLVLDYGKKYFDTVILRYFNIYGPRDVGNEHIIPYTISSVLYDKELKLHAGAEKRTRTFMYITDCVNGTLLAFDKGRNGEIFNIGSTEEVTIGELVEKIFDLCQKKVNVTYDELPSGDPIRRCPDITKAEASVGFRPSVSLRDGLLEMISWERRKLGK